MAKETKIRTLNESGEDEEVLDLAFSDEEWEILGDFVRYVGDLKKRTLVREGLPVSLTIRWSEGNGRLFRLDKGFRTSDGRIAEHGMDIIATIKVQALLARDPLNLCRSEPAKTALASRQRLQGTGRPSSIPLRSFDTEEDLETFLRRDPRPVVEWFQVPRIAFRFAYWPLSSRAFEVIRRIHAEGREPTFEEVEGRDISRAWEIFEQTEAESQAGA